MKLTVLNKYLSVYQLIGFSITFIILTDYCLKEGRMAVYYIPIAGLLFLPFLIISLFGLLKKDKHKRRIQGGIYLGLIFLILPSLSLPLFYELGGFIITLVCIFIATIVIINRDKMYRQLVIMNSIGALILSTIVAEYFLSLSKYL